MFIKYQVFECYRKDKIKTNQRQSASYKFFTMTFMRSKGGTVYFVHNDAASMCFKCTQTNLLV